MFSKALFEHMEKLRGQMTAVDLRDSKVFFKNLIFVYQLITASEELIEQAMELLPPGDGLRNFYLAKLIEERGHAEWLGNDLTNCGHHFKPLNRTAMAMAGSQYWMVFHLTPASLLGYMAALECFPASLATVEMLEEYHGIKALATVRYHAEIDVDHGKELLAFIDSRPTDEHSSIWLAATIATEWLIKASASFSGEPACGILPAYAG